MPALHTKPIQNKVPSLHCEAVRQQLLRRFFQREVCSFSRPPRGLAIMSPAIAAILHAQPRNTATHQALLGQRKATVARKTSSEANRSSVETALLRPSSCSPPRLPSAPAAAHAASSRARDRSMTSQHRRRQALLAGARATRRRTASISSSERRQLRMMPFVLLGSRISTGE